MKKLLGGTMILALVSLLSAAPQAPAAGGPSTTPPQTTGKSGGKNHKMAKHAKKDASHKQPKTTGK